MQVLRRYRRQLMSARDFIPKVSRKQVALAATVAVLLIIAGAIIYLVRVNRSIGSERERLQAESRVEVEQRELRPASSDGLTLYVNAADVRAVASFKGGYYLATSGGLIALDNSGVISRRFTTVDGLPDIDLTSLAVFRERLFVGTAGAGLVSYDGISFTGYRFNKPKATHISLLVPTETELLIGTLDGGLFEYNGERFSRRFNSAAGADFNRVTALLSHESRLFVGTQDSGLFIWREGHIEHIATPEGLPSPHVTAIAVIPDFAGKPSICVATDFGVVAIDDDNNVKSISNRPNVTSIVASDRHLWAGLFSGGVVDLNAAAGVEQISPIAATSVTSELSGLPSSVPVTLSADNQRLFALTPVGAFVRDERTARRAFEPMAGSLVGDRVLTAGHITGLALDGSSRLWVGYFDRGIDVLAPETSERISHIEDDRVREINYLTFDGAGYRMLVATSRGLVTLAANLKQTVITREQGLIDDSVAHIALGEVDTPLLASSSGRPLLEKPRGRAMVLATAGGLTEISGGRARSITAFHGLASNHLYSSAVAGSRLFVGSLAGLVELEGLRVVRTYKTSNSRLSHDWVTAIAEVEGTLYVGTNGGGVDALLPTGEWINFADELGKFEVNQNAMHYDGERLYVGTSDRGFLVYNTRGRSWTRFNAGLPSQSITAITSDDRFVYVGTMNGLVRIEKRVIG